MKGRENQTPLAVPVVYYFDAGQCLDQGCEDIILPLIFCPFVEEQVENIFSSLCRLYIGSHRVHKNNNSQFYLWRSS